MNKQINYVEYEHSYAHAIQPKLKCINYNANVLKKPANYVKAIVRNALNQSKEVRWTDKEQWFFDTVMSMTEASQISFFCKNAVNKAKETLVWVDENGELEGF